MARALQGDLGRGRQRFSSVGDWQTEFKNCDGHKSRLGKKAWHLPCDGIVTCGDTVHRDIFADHLKFSLG